MRLFNTETQPLVTVGTPPLRWVEAMSEFLTTSEFANTWGVEGGTGCRVVFTWANGLRITWLGETETPPNVVQVWWDTQAEASLYPGGVHQREPVPVPVGGDLPHEWDAATQTWMFEVTVVDVLNLVSEAVTVFGAPDLALPWEPFATGNELVDVLQNHLPDGVTGSVAFWDAVNGIEGEAFDELVETLEGEDQLETAPVLAAAAYGALVHPFGGVDGRVGVAEMVYGTDVLPPHAAFHRFEKMVAAVEALPDWVVIWNECCGTCARSSIDFAYSDKGLTRDTGHALVIYGQNAQYSWMPSGRVEWTTYGWTDSEFALLVREASLASLRTSEQGDERHDLTVWG